MTSSTGHPKNNWFKTNNVIHGDAEIITIHTLFYFKNGGGSARCISAPESVCGGIVYVFRLGGLRVGGWCRWGGLYADV